jgi:NAD(P)H-hydrate epimerase
MSIVQRDDIPRVLYRAEAVRQLDRVAIADHGIPGLTLMRRAARAAFALLLERWPEPQHISIFCGSGNNGGDGYVMATLARKQGLPVTVVQVGDPAKITGDALQARKLALQDGVEVLPLAALEAIADGVVVDAMLGTGLAGDVRDDYGKAIEWINVCGQPVLAVDIPSGLCSDSGQQLGTAVLADLTVTFIGVKQGLLTGRGPAVCGELYFAGLQVPETVYLDVPVSSERLDLQYHSYLLAARDRAAHKGQFGHVLVAGGDKGKAGAAAMAAQAATRTGAGLVSCATRPEHVAALVARCPEVMTQGVISGQEIEPLLETPSVLVIGPGLGQGAWGEQLLQKVWAQNKPMVVDADALNILASARVVQQPHRDNWILTPHPGEAARLLDCTVTEVEQDRFKAVRELQRRFGGAVILKGAGTLVMTADRPYPAVCPYGNPGMASGGMGDVLSGVLGALLAQGLSVADAARLGVCLHAGAADMAAADGERGMVATDLLAYLRLLVNPE